MRVLVLPSPLLGAGVYQPLADALGAGATSATVAEIRGRTLASVLDGFTDQAAGVDLLVPHSNAGRFAAAVAAAVGAGTVHLDATLPGTPPPPAFLARLEGLVDDDGLLPGWTDWWPSDAVDALLGSWRPRVEAEQGRWPLEFLLHDPPAPAGWQRHRAAYLAFAGGPDGTEVGYAEELDRARGWGWPVGTVPGHHLQHLLDPAGVAAAVHRSWLASTRA